MVKVLEILLPAAFALFCCPLNTLELVSVCMCVCVCVCVCVSHVRVFQEFRTKKEYSLSCFSVCLRV